MHFLSRATCEGPNKRLCGRCLATSFKHAGQIDASVRARLIIYAPAERPCLAQLGKPFTSAIKSLIIVVTPRGFARTVSIDGQLLPGGELASLLEVGVALTTISDGG